MDRKEIESRMLDLIAIQFSVDVKTIGLGTDVKNELGADSLDTIEIIMAIEEEFGIVISEGKERRMPGYKVSDFVDFVEKHLTGDSAAV